MVLDEMLYFFRVKNKLQYLYSHGIVALFWCMDIKVCLTRYTTMDVCFSVILIVFQWHHFSSETLVAIGLCNGCLSPSLCMNQLLAFINCKLENKLNSNSNLNSTSFCHEKGFVNVVCNIAVLCSSFSVLTMHTKLRNSCIHLAS